MIVAMPALQTLHRPLCVFSRLVQSVPGGRAFPGITLLTPTAASAPIDPSRPQTLDATSMDAAAAAAEEPVILAAAPTHLKSDKSAGKKPRVNWSMYEVDQLIAEIASIMKKCCRTRALA